MKVLLALILLHFGTPRCPAQCVTFHEGAGINPRHIESIGRDSGWVEYWAGPMAISGQVIKINFENWSEIENIFIECACDNGTIVADVIPNADSKNYWVGIQNTKAVQVGQSCRVSYIVKYKKA